MNYRFKQQRQLTGKFEKLKESKKMKTSTLDIKVSNEAVSQNVHTPKISRYFTFKDFLELLIIIENYIWVFIWIQNVRLNSSDYILTLYVRRDLLYLRTSI